MSLARGYRIFQSLSDLWVPLTSACRTSAIMSCNTCLCFQQLPNSGTSALSTPSQAKQKPIPQAAPRQAKMLGAQSSLCFRPKEEPLVLGVGDASLSCVEGGESTVMQNATKFSTSFSGIFSWFYIGLDAVASQLSLEFSQSYYGPYIVVNSLFQSGGDGRPGAS